MSPAQYACAVKYACSVVKLVLKRLKTLRSETRVKKERIPFMKKKPERNKKNLTGELRISQERKDAPTNVNALR